MFSSTWKRVGLLAGGLLLLGCTSPTTTTRQSSLLDYLSSGEQAAATGAEAKVRLPLEVGVAFLPGGSVASQGLWKTGGKTEAVFITAQDEARLATAVQARFSGKPWVRSLKLIPSFYLRERGGFQDVERVAALNRVDVMILVSLNQVQFTSPKWYSIANWTGLGAYTREAFAQRTWDFYLRETGIPLAPLVCGIRQDSFENLERTLLDMEREYADATAWGDVPRARACRRAAIVAKDHARFALRSPRLTAAERAAKEEMVLWLLTWLENPGVFATWLELRKKVAR